MICITLILAARAITSFYSPTVDLQNLETKDSLRNREDNEDENSFERTSDILDYPTVLMGDSESENNEKMMPKIELKAPKNALRSIRYGKIKTNPENLETLINNEMNDMSPDLHNKITKKINKNNVDLNKYRDVFLIKKRVIQDGKKKIVSFDIKEKVIPKSNTQAENMNKDFGIRAMLAGILFLLAGLVFTTTMKMYQNLFKRKYFNYEKKQEFN